MIDNTIVCFPNNVISMLKAALQTIDPPTEPGGDDGLRIEERPVRNTDYSETLGLFAGAWTPNQDTMEIGGHEPTVQRYTVIIESLVHDMDQERGIATHSLLSALVRHTLYRNPGVRVGLPLLTVPLGGHIEKLQRWGIGQQRFMNNDASGNFVFLSATDFWFETTTERM